MKWVCLRQWITSSPSIFLIRGPAIAISLHEDMYEKMKMEVEKWKKRKIWAVFNSNFCKRVGDSFTNKTTMEFWVIGIEASRRREERRYGPMAGILLVDRRSTDCVLYMIRKVFRLWTFDSQRISGSVQN